MQFSDGQPLADLLRQLRQLGPGGAATPPPEPVLAAGPESDPPAGADVERTTAYRPAPLSAGAAAADTAALAGPLTARTREGRGYFRSAARPAEQAAGGLQHAPDPGGVPRGRQPRKPPLDPPAHPWGG